MKKYLLFSSAFALTCLSSSVSKAQNYALSLNGSTYVSCGVDALLNPSNIKTMECWVKFNDFTGDQEILSRSTAGSGIELLVYGSNLSFFCMNSVTSSTSRVDYPLTNLSTGTWYHVAVTWDGTKENMRLYVNGISVGTRTDFGNVNTGLSLPTGSFMIGQWSQVGSPRLLKGSVDEVRVWSTNRSATQIKAGMYANYSTGSNGLTAYYPCDESSGTLISNILNNSLLNGLVTGTVAKVVSPIKFASNALNFDGADDQVIVPANTLFDLTTGTVECWVRPTALSSSIQACFLGNRNTSARFSLHMASNQIGLFATTTGYKTIALPNAGTFNNNQWYHIAVVFKATNTLVYVDGALLGAVDFRPNTTITGQLLTIGITKDGTGNNMEAFKGDIDDVRIWGTIRTPEEIADNRNKPLSGTEAGLNANYTFNTGISSSVDNAGLRVAIDATPNNLHGTLTNFALTGSVSNYTASAVVILPVQLSAFTATKSGTNCQLSWTAAQEQNSKSFVVEHSVDGTHFTHIGTVAAAGTSNKPASYSFVDFKPAAGTNYYRLQLVDADGKNSYTKTAIVKFPQTEVVAVSPNPASHVLNYSVSSLQATKVSVNIIATTGQKVQSFTAAVQAGSNNLSVDVSRLPASNYTLQIVNTPAGIASTQQFSVVR